MGIRIMMIILGVGSFAYAADRTVYQAELKKMGSPALNLLMAKHKYSPNGLTGYCQVNHKKLITLAEDKNLTETARTERELPLLKKETDKRCFAAYYEYVDICAELRSRNKVQNSEPNMKKLLFPNGLKVE